MEIHESNLRLDVLQDDTRHHEIECAVFECVEIRHCAADVGRLPRKLVQPLGQLQHGGRHVYADDAVEVGRERLGQASDAAAEIQGGAGPKRNAL